MKEPLCKLKTKEELKKDIQSKIVELYQERQKLSVEYREKVKKIDIELSELDYKLMSGEYWLKGKLAKDINVRSNKLKGNNNSWRGEARWKNRKLSL